MKTMFKLGRKTTPSASVSSSTFAPNIPASPPPSYSPPGEGNSIPFGGAKDTMNTAAGLHTHSETVKNIYDTLSALIADNNANPDMQVALSAVYQTVEILDRTQMDWQIVECLTSFTQTISHILKQTRINEFKDECDRFQSSIREHLSDCSVLAEIIKSSQGRFFEMVKTRSFDGAAQKPQMDGDSYHRKDKVTMTSYKNTTLITGAGSRTYQNFTLDANSVEVPYRSITENEHGAEVTYRNINIDARQFAKIGVMHENKASLNITSSQGDKITAAKGVSQITLSNHARTNIEGMTITAEDGDIDLFTGSASMKKYF